MSIVYTPQQKDRAKRKYRHLLNVAQALSLQACLSSRFWGECIKMTVLSYQ